MAKSTLGIFYKMIGRTADAISVLLEVINSLSILKGLFILRVIKK